MEATEKQMTQATKVMNSICAMLDNEELSYDRNDKGMSIYLEVDRQEFPFDVKETAIVLIFKVIPAVDLVILDSPIKLTTPEENRVDVSLAMMLLNRMHCDGTWVIDSEDGLMDFRITNSYHDSILGKGCFKEMMNTTISAVKQYDGKLCMIGEGKLSLEEFVQSIEE